MKVIWILPAFSMLVAGCSGMHEVPAGSQQSTSTETPAGALAMQPDKDSTSLTLASSPAKPAAKPSVKHPVAKGHLTLSWNPVAGAKWYNLYYDTKPGVTKSSPGKITKIFKTTHTVTGLSSDATYYFVVTAGNSVTEGPESREISGKPKK